MAGAVIRHNPASLEDTQLVAQFVVRKAEHRILREIVAEAGAGAPNQHVLVVGARGSGKSTLLRRVAVDCRLDTTLSSQWVPVVLSEEIYGVASLGELWLESLRALAERDGSTDLTVLAESLRRERDERRLRDRALGALREHARHRARKILLVVENLQMVLDAGQLDEDDSWALREALQTEPWLFLLGSAVTGLEAARSKKKPFYGSFRTITLSPLTTDECRDLWRHITSATLEDKRIRPVEILTGGSPRLIAILGSFAQSMELRNLFEHLTQLIDDNTTYFKATVEALPLQERKLLVALAELWHPATGAELAERSRLERTKVGSLTSRLVQKGVISEVEGFGKIKNYEVAERLYNVYFLMRKGGVAEAQVRMVVELLLGLYEPDKAAALLKSLHTEAATDGSVAEVLRRIEAELVDRGAWNLLGERGEAFAKAKLSRWTTEVVEFRTALEEITSRLAPFPPERKRANLAAMAEMTTNAAARYVAYTLAGDVDSAGQVLRQLPVNPMVAEVVARTSRAGRNKTEVRRAIAAALDSKSQHPGIWLCMFDVSLSEGDEDRANTALDAIQRLAPSPLWDMVVMNLCAEHRPTVGLAKRLVPVALKHLDGPLASQDTAGAVSVLASAGAIPEALERIERAEVVEESVWLALFAVPFDALDPYVNRILSVAGRIASPTDEARVRLAAIAFRSRDLDAARSALDLVTPGIWRADRELQTLYVGVAIASSTADAARAFVQDSFERSDNPGNIALAAAMAVATLGREDLAESALAWLRRAPSETNEERGIASILRAELRAITGDADGALSAVTEALADSPEVARLALDYPAFPVTIARAGRAGALIEIFRDTPYATDRNPWFVALNEVAGTPIRAPREVREAAADLVEGMRPVAPERPATKKRSRRNP